jgi:hypothetical protein
MTVSAEQQEQFNTFVTRRSAGAVMELAVEAIIAAGLDWGSLGMRWGITVCDDASVLRLNVGRHVLLDVTMDQGIQLLVIQSPGSPTHWGDDVRVFSGFPDVEHSGRLVALHPDHLTELLLDRVELAPLVRAHAEVSGTDLPRPDLHNPLVNELLEQVADSVFDDYEGDYSQYEYEDDGEESPLPAVTLH